MTSETDFERWMRNNPELKSEEGICRFDLDVLLHRYKFEEDGKGDRTIQCMMFIEVKTGMEKLSEAQRDTLSLFNQVLRNRKPNIHSRPRSQIENAPVTAYSKIHKRNIRLYLYGGHLLRISGTRPDNSDFIEWDGRHQLTVKELEEMLRFERDPDRPHLKLDHRRRSRSWKKAPKLFD